MKLRYLGLPLLFAFSVARAAPEPVAPAPSEREARTAQCVAALRTNTDGLADSVRAGHAEYQVLLRERLEYGAALIGSAYLAGDRDEQRAKALLKLAAQSQAAMAPAERDALVLSCAAQASAQLQQAGIVARAVVSRVAAGRMKKLLDWGAQPS